MLRGNVQRSILESLGLFIDVLSFSDEYADHIEVSILAGSPNMLEGMLATIAFAQVESQFVLRSPHLSQDVVISFPLEQGVACSSMTVVRRIVQWSPLAMILRVNICTTLEKKYAGVKTAALASQVKRCALQIILPFHFCLIDEQSLQKLNMIVHSSQMKRGSLLI